MVCVILAVVRLVEEIIVEEIEVVVVRTVVVMGVVVVCTVVAIVVVNDRSVVLVVETVVRLVAMATISKRSETKLRY